MRALAFASALFVALTWVVFVWAVRRSARRVVRRQRELDVAFEYIGLLVAAAIPRRDGSPICNWRFALMSRGVVSSRHARHRAAVAIPAHMT
jgi:hypothetical protein